MTETNNKLRFLNGNVLKFIACASMLIDHMGVILFPEYDIFRILGRIAFPIFAFMIAEGCRYTRNKLKHFLMIFGLGILCQIVYIVSDYRSGISYMNILITFSFSIGTIYALQLLKAQMFSKKVKALPIIGAALLLVGAVVSTYVFNVFIELDYGFTGAMLPVIASAFMFDPRSEHKARKYLDKNIFHVLCLAVGLVLLFIESQNPVKHYALIALIPLLFYSGKRGKLNTKYFFYIFYPLHLGVLYIISYLIYYLA